MNGEPVTQMDVNLASSQLTQRLKGIYGEDFTLEDLDEAVSVELIKNEVINQKVMISMAKDLGLKCFFGGCKKRNYSDGFISGRSRF